MSQQPEQAILAHLQRRYPAMIALLEELVRMETPSTVPESQAQILSRLLDQLRDLHFDVQLLEGHETGGHLVAHPTNSNGHAMQLLIGHCDTVWPIGTLREMPVEIEGNSMRGPGVYDMKAGLVQMLFALEALQALHLVPSLVPVVFINSDEEIGSHESASHIAALAQKAERAFILEAALGLEGKLKTRRKGVGKFQVATCGRAAHAGLDPDKGISAIVEMSHIIQKLHALNDFERGISVNVGLLEGGVRANVIAARSHAIVDVRVPDAEAAEQVTAAIYNLQPTLPGASIQVTGGIERVPLERTPRNRRLWETARESGRRLGLALAEGSAGGASDGNITSQFTATLDGLGAVGDGAHADHEFIYLDKLIERTALLALLLLAPSQ